MAKTLYLKYWLHLFYATMLVCYCICGFAQDSWNLTKLINDQNGLPQNSAKTVYFDTSTSFLWIATEGGLVRYDGTYNKVFDSRNIVALSSPRFNKFLSVGGTDVMCINEEVQLIQIKGNNVALIELLPNKKEFEAIHHTTLAAPTKRRLARLMSIANESKNDNAVLGNETAWLNDSIWVNATQEKLQLLNGDRLVQSWKKPYGSSSLLIRGGYIYLVFPDGTGYCINLKTLQLKPLNAYRGEIESGIPLKSYDSWQERGASGNTNFYFDAHNNQPIFKVGDSIYTASFAADTIKAAYLATIPGLPSYISSIILHPNKNVVYVGTFSNGLYIYRKSPFRVYRVDGNGVANNNYATVLPDSNHVLTTRSILFNLTTGLSKKIPFAMNNYLGMAIDKEGNYWNNDGPNHLKFNLTSATGIKQPFSDKTQSPANYYTTKSGHTYLVNSNYFGIIEAGKIREIMPLYSQGLPFFEYLTEDPDGNLIGVRRTDIYRIDTLKKTIIAIMGKTEISYIRNIFIDNDWHCWIATYGNGIFNYDLRARKLYSLPAGYPYELLYAHALIEDGQGKFIVPTNKGLFRIDKQQLLDVMQGRSPSLNYFYYDVSYGLQTNEFNGGCQPLYHRLPGGDILLPSIDGLVRVKQEKFNPAMPGKIFIDEIETAAKIYSGNELMGTVVFGTAERSLVWTLSFAKWEQQAITTIYYHTDTDTAWKPLPYSERKIRLTELRGGSHQLHIKYQYGLSKNECSIFVYDFKIGKEYFEQWWFWLLLLFALFALFGGLINYNSRVLQKRNKKLQLLVDKKTKQLHIKNEDLQETMDDLSMALDKLEAESLFKTRLLGMMGHDLIVPLRYLESVSHNIEQGNSVSPALSMVAAGAIKTTARQLLIHGEGILQWIKAMEGKLKLQLGYMDVFEAVEAVLAVSRPLAVSKQNKLINKVTPGLTCMYDSMLIKVILHNLVVNANKFTAAGTIAVSAQLFNNELKIIVNDTGYGMDADMVASLNNLQPIASAPGTHNETGWGMGFVLNIDLVRFANGTIHVESEPEKGTSVTVSFPVGGNVV